MTTAPPFQLHHIYDDAAAGRGYRVLVDRLWPRRGEEVGCCHRRMGQGPRASTELRRWYGHQPNRFDELACRYRTELEAPAATDALAALLDRSRKTPVTLVTATRDVQHSGAKVLLDRVIRAADRTAP
jgi:uncharacterized protein YeaO (DUF488 family)